MLEILLEILLDSFCNAWFCSDNNIFEFTCKLKVFQFINIVVNIYK